MKTTTIIPILAALTLAAACTKTIEFSGKETASLPVLISQAEADNTTLTKVYTIPTSPYTKTTPSPSVSSCPTKVNSPPDAASPPVRK